MVLVNEIEGAHVPMLLVRSSMKAKAIDWSAQVTFLKTKSFLTSNRLLLTKEARSKWLNCLKTKFEIHWCVQFAHLVQMVELS